MILFRSAVWLVLASMLVAAVLILEPPAAAAVAAIASSAVSWGLRSSFCPNGQREVESDE